jgi:Ca2+-binding RTX toxin-like protein
VDGTISTWLMDGASRLDFGVRRATDPSWTLLDGHGDYNGDGRSDILLRAPTGEVTTWLVNGNSIIDQETYGGISPLWNFVEEAGVALSGDNGSNTLTGTVSANILRGFGGADTLTGGGGGDRFVFETALDGATNVDTVRDFKSGQDKLLLSDEIFTRVGPGPLSAGQFVAGPGAQAQDTDDFILYNTTTGRLSYDADGNGAGLAVAFATLFGQPTLIASDIVSHPA